MLRHFARLIRLPQGLKRRRNGRFLALETTFSPGGPGGPG